MTTATTACEPWPLLLLRHFSEFAAARRQGYWVQAARHYPEGYAVAICIGDARIRESPDEVRKRLETFLAAPERATMDGSATAGSASEDISHKVDTGIAGSDHLIGPTLGAMLGAIAGIYLSARFAAAAPELFFLIGGALAGAGVVAGRDYFLIRRDRRRAAAAAQELIRSFNVTGPPPDESSVYTVDQDWLAAAYFHRYGARR